MRPALLRPSRFRPSPRFARWTGKFRIARWRGLFVVKILNRAALYLFSEHALDTPDHWLVLMRNEREGVPGLCGPARASDPVRVGVRGVRHVIVDHVRYG